LALSREHLKIRDCIRNTPRYLSCWTHEILVPEYEEMEAQVNETPDSGRPLIVDDTTNLAR